MAEMPILKDALLGETTKVSSNEAGKEKKMPGDRNLLLGKTTKAQDKDVNRLILKSGKVNATIYTVVAWNPFTFNNVVRLNWFNIIHIFLALQIISWNFFAIVYYIMELNNICINDVSNYVGAVLYSIETQQTIGYGKRYAHPEGCFYITIIIIWQTIIGILLKTIAIGIVLVKFSRPKYRADEIKFSRRGVVTHRNGELCLLIRIADNGENRLVGAEVDAMLYKSVITQEGEYIELQPHKVHFGYNLVDGNSTIPLLWPICISHKIDQNSPFYDMKPPFDKHLFELIIWLSGTDEETGTLAQARTSFTEDEIKWESKFCTKLSKKGEEVVVFYDDKAMNKITNDDTAEKMADDMNQVFNYFNKEYDDVNVMLSDIIELPHDMRSNIGQI